MWPRGCWRRRQSVVMGLIDRALGFLGVRCKVEAMIKSYLYVFAFCRPSEAESDGGNGREDDSYAFFIEAPSEGAALRRGQEISEIFVARLGSD